MPWIRRRAEIILASPTDPGCDFGQPAPAVTRLAARPGRRRSAVSGWRARPRTRHDGAVVYATGWPATLTEPALLGAPVALRPLAARDARPWREARVRNAEWL